MFGWLDDLAGPVLGPILMILLIVLIIAAALWPARSMLRARLNRLIPGGHRDRKARLAVLDVAAVDSRRRLVLIRRDEVEHLVLIGGPNDIVVEQNIRRRAAPAHGVQAPAVRAPAPEPAPAPAVAPAAPAPAVSRPEPPVAPAPVAAPPVPRVEPPAAAERVVPPVVPPAAPARPAKEDPSDFDRDLFRAIEDTLANIPTRPDPAPEATPGENPAEAELTGIRPERL